MSLHTAQQSKSGAAISEHDVTVMQMALSSFQRTNEKQVKQMLQNLYALQHYFPQADVATLHILLKSFQKASNLMVNQQSQRLLEAKTEEDLKD